MAVALGSALRGCSCCVSMEYVLKIEHMARKKKAKVYQYTAVLEPDTEVGGYTVTIPALPGCISEGDTFEDALHNIQEAAELYLEVMRRDKTEISAEEAGVVIAPVRVHAMV